MMRGAWWDAMTCAERTRFLRSGLKPEGFQILFPMPVLTSLIHTDWNRFNRRMRRELESLRG
ncbi:MAG TPA: hypothetical protein VEY12_03495 [Thermoplasmata archaeon]|nr:hypothetical protein [Thermoplasmata archaeon]